MKYKLSVERDSYKPDHPFVKKLKSLGFVFKEEPANSSWLMIDKEAMKERVDAKSSQEGAYVFYDVEVLDDITSLEAEFRKLDTLQEFRGLVIREQNIEIYNDYRE